MVERRTLGRFVCGDRVASGPVGALHRARVYGDAGFEKDFALLLVADELARERGALGRLVRAANSWARLSHPRIARAHELAAEGDTYYLVSDWIRGAPLSALLGDGPLPLDAALLVAIDVAEGLAHAHSRADLVPGGILHLGLSPECVLVDGEGQVLVRDFGLLQARVQPGWEDDDKLVYSLRYAAPEVHAGRSQLDARADVFSLGAILFELLAGRAAFAGARARAVVAQADQSPPSLTGIPPAAGPLLARALAARAGARLPSVSELRSQAESLLGERAEAARRLLAQRALPRLPTNAGRPATLDGLPAALPPPPATGIRQPSLAEDFFASGVVPEVTDRVPKLPAPPSMLGAPAHWGGRPLLPPPSPTVWDPPSTTATTTLDALRRRRAMRWPPPLATLALLTACGVLGALGWKQLERMRPSLLEPTRAATPLSRRVETPPPAVAGKELPAAPGTTGTTPPLRLPTQVTSRPAGAEIYADGTLVGTTPATLTLRPGAHTLVLASESYRLWRGSIEAGTGVDTALVAAVLPDSVAGKAGLKVVCKSAGEWRVIVDGADSGRTCPVEQRIAVRPGLHRLSLYSPRGNRSVVVEREITVKNRGASTRIILEQP